MQHFGMLLHPCFQRGTAEPLQLLSISPFRRTKFTNLVLPPAHSQAYWGGLSRCPGVIFSNKWVKACAGSPPAAPLSSMALLRAQPGSLFPSQSRGRGWITRSGRWSRRFWLCFSWGRDECSRTTYGTLLGWKWFSGKLLPHFCLCATTYTNVVV